MTKIVSTPNCGNSPKMALLTQFNIAFAKADIEFLTEHVTDDIEWNIMGDRHLVGKSQFIEQLEKLKCENVAELTLCQVLSHGKEGAANGILKMPDGQQYSFADFYRFHGAKNVKIKAITSYCIKT
ncbi:nuclear transport factor 2 family protein [Planctobacterium marinum]|uniref:nuclear transport factor 2 family protein n=1 Tax=Planctobacterium marinum TaxID=1631968 RepID=UPI001E53049E|nr:nuclear transport factor 2 family protein [Planctobacterium marinum]MCC2606778.1 nuclear transport factor 2 family protein [Planctobacterium marinum]